MHWSMNICLLSYTLLLSLTVEITVNLTTLYEGIVFVNDGVATWLDENPTSVVISYKVSSLFALPSVVTMSVLWVSFCVIMLTRLETPRID